MLFLLLFNSAFNKGTSKNHYMDVPLWAQTFVKEGFNPH